MRSRYHGRVALPSPQSFASFPSVGAHLRRNGFFTARSGKIFHMDVPGDQMHNLDGDDDAASWSERYNAVGNESETSGSYTELSVPSSYRKQQRQGPYDPHRFFVTVRASSASGEDQADYAAASKAVELLHQRRHRDERFKRSV